MAATKPRRFSLRCNRTMRQLVKSEKNSMEFLVEEFKPKMFLWNNYCWKSLRFTGIFLQQTATR